MVGDLKVCLCTEFNNSDCFNILFFPSMDQIQTWLKDGTYHTGTSKTDSAHPKVKVELLDKMTQSHYVLLLIMSCC